MVDAADFGERLRAQRKRRGISLQQIADDTKINASLLIDLERGDLSRWPAGIFGRAFVRSYAEAVGLEPREVLNEYVQFAPADGAADAAPSQEPLLPGWGFGHARPRPRPVLVEPSGIRLTLAEPDASARLRIRRWLRRFAALAVDVAILGCGAVIGALAGRPAGWLFGVAGTGVAVVLLSSAVLGTTPGRRLFGPPARLHHVRARRWKAPRLVTKPPDEPREDQSRLSANGQPPPLG